MRTSLRPAPWYAGTPSPLIHDAISILGRGVWTEAATEFAADRIAREKRGVSAPKGVQAYINRSVTSRMVEAGWEGVDGRFRRDDTWVRLTFRHQMSLGADILDALKVCKKEGVRTAGIFAATTAFLRLISPNDAPALVSYEKLAVGVDELNGCLDIPLFIGRLEPASPLTAEVAAALAGTRSRDRTVPRSG